MKEITNSKYAAYFYAGLLLIVLCAWYSIGFYHVDEHVQVLEFANWKLGNIPDAGMPWEFHKQVRISLLPWIVFVFCKALGFVGLYNPFTITFLLRLFIGLASWFITCKFCLLLVKNVKTEKGQKVFILISLFLWYVPFLDVRFTSENFTGVLFLYGLYILFRNFEKGKNNFSMYLIAGLLFGICFFVRVAFVYAIIAFGVWLIFLKKVKWKYLFVLTFGVLLGVGLNILLDCLFYGKPAFTLFNLTNVYVHHAGGMQVNPWWFYLKQYIGRITPPFSVFFLAVFILGAYKNRKDPLVWIVITFILMHFVIRHKELRFLFSINFIFTYVIALGIDYLLTKKVYLKVHNYIYYLFVIISLPLLLLRTFTPANISINYCKYVYNHIKGKDVPVFMLKSSTPDHVWNPSSLSLFTLQNNDDNSFLMANKTFYRNPNINPILVKTIEQLSDTLKAYKQDTTYYLDKSGGENTIQLNGYKVTEVYSLAPDWLSKIIAIYADDKAAEWKIYCISKSEAVH